MSDIIEPADLPRSELDILQQFSNFRQSRDNALRDTLVCKHLHLVQGVARRFSGMGESLEDLIQEGSIGLLKAVDMFDPERGVKFSTYASHLITSQMQHYLRDRGRLIRQPAWIQELNTKVQRTTEQLTQELGRDPQLAEVAERLNLSETSISSAMATRDLNTVISLSGSSDSNENEVPLLDKEKSLSTKLHALQLPVEDQMLIEEAISKLKTLEQNVIRHFFYEDLNQTEIARKLGISVNYSSYLLRRAINKLRTMLELDESEANAMLAPEPPALPAETDVPTFDRYTGLYTDIYLRARIAEEIARGRRYPTNFSLMLLEIAELGVAEKNDDYLDMVTTLGQVFRQNTRIIDLICYPGDGFFAFLLPHTGRESRVLGQRLAQHVSNLYGQLKAKDPAPTITLGYAVFPMDGSSVDALFRRAHASLDGAKQQRSDANDPPAVTEMKSAE